MVAVAVGVDEVVLLVGGVVGGVVLCTGVEVFVVGALIVI